MKVTTEQRTQIIRKITKLDYMEYMVEKFGSRAAIYFPEEETLKLHTTYIMKDRCKNALNQCNQISETIMRSLERKEKKNFKWMDWQSNVIQKATEISTSA